MSPRNISLLYGRCTAHLFYASSLNNVKRKKKEVEKEKNVYKMLFYKLKSNLRNEAI